MPAKETQSGQLEWDGLLGGGRSGFLNHQRITPAGAKGAYFEGVS